MPEPYASKQRRLLETEGIAVDLRGLDLKIYGWLPKKPKPAKRKAKRAKLR
jgi:ribosomal protein S12